MKKLIMENGEWKILNPNLAVSAARPTFFRNFIPPLRRVGG
jgi:hypothetical protein